MDTKSYSSGPGLVLLPYLNYIYIPFLNYEAESKNKQKDKRNQHQC